jgi:DNA-binding MarR family transcriptional regulator
MGEQVRDAQPSETAALIADILGLAERLRQQWEAPCEEQGVSGSRFAILAAIQQSASDGIAQTQLAAGLNLSESNVSVLVEALRKAGLLHRLRSKTDRRRSVLLLSPTGRELVALLTAARNALADMLVEGISREQLADLRRVLRELDARAASSAHGGSEDAPVDAAVSRLRKAS